MVMKIAGIQQIGIGVRDVGTAFAWYRRHFGMDIPAFETRSTADVMLRYTGQSPAMRHALCALNLAGGGGFELWQYLEREPRPAPRAPMLGDLGIFIAKIKSGNIDAAHAFLLRSGVDVLCAPTSSPTGERHFFVRDPFGNLFEVVQKVESLETDEWFSRRRALFGGVCGAVVGVGHMPAALDFYAGVLGYDRVIDDRTGCFEDFASLPGGSRACHRVLLARSQPRVGAFSRLLGPNRIELVCAKDAAVSHLYAGRQWGDPGFIHLCFDVCDMDDIKQHCAQALHPFTVDSADSHSMGDAAGRFAYIEDPDGTLVELVETHRVAILAKLGWHLDLRRRPAERPLPDWMLHALRLRRVKDRAGR